MPETLPGCRLMAGRGRRSNMETGKVHYQLLFSPTDFFLLNFGLICLLFFFWQHQDHYVLLPSALHLLPWSGVWLVWKPGPVFALERAQETGTAGGHLGLIRHRKLSQRVLLLAFLKTLEWTLSTAAAWVRGSESFCVSLHTFSWQKHRTVKQ